MIMISNFPFSLINFYAIVSFFTKALCILFLMAVRELVVTKLVILGILPLTSFILALREALVSKLVILGVSPLTSFILV